ncbi:MAG: sugar ABC transporter substrate-binding protein [Spirochaetia bacterium]|jgi:ribose transport system substrate-binding protein|nr:sugar ABC transporter substrate-binding protein [Spirochaetia bacterium]
MKRTIGLLLPLLLLSSAFAFANGEAESKQTDTKKQIHIAVVLKTLSEEHWQKVAAGCREAAAKAGAEVDILAPPQEDNIIQQINMVEDSLATHPDALIVAPSQPKTAKTVISKAKKSGIPVIIIDTPMPDDFKDYDTFIGTANYDAGCKGAQFMIDNWNKPTANVVIMEGTPGNPSCGDRAKGASTIYTAKGYKIVAYQPGYSDKEKAFNTMQNILEKTPDVDIVFCANDNMALGAARACIQAGCKARVMGFDGEKQGIQAVADGTLYADVAQRANKMGTLAVEAAIKLLNGQTVDKTVNSGIDILTKNNVQTLISKAK